jgi:hypothetical protein
LKQILVEFSQLERLMESVTRLINKLMRVLPNTFLDYVSELVQLVISKFEQFPHSAFIFSFETCLKEFNRYPQFA